MSVKNRGFASMSPAKRSEVAKKGAEAAKAKGVGHRWTPKEAKSASVEGTKVRRQHRDERLERIRKAKEA